jgi:hypothetical protein
MSTLLLLAATAPCPFSSARSASNGASGDISDFHQVLQRMSLDTTSSTDSGRDLGMTPAANSSTDPSPAESALSSGLLADAAQDPVNDATVFLRNLSATAGRGTNVLSNPAVSNPQSSVADLLSGAKAEKEKCTGKTFFVNPKGAAGTKESSGGDKSTAAASPVVFPVVSVATPAETALLSNSFTTADSASVDPVGFDPLARSTSGPGPLTNALAVASPTAVATSLSAAGVRLSIAGHIGNSAVGVDAAATSTAVPTLALEPTTHAALSTATAKIKAKAQVAIAFDENSEVAEAVTGSVPAAATKASQNFANAQPAIEQQNFVKGNSSGHIGSSAVEVDAAATSTAVPTLALEPTTHAAISTAAAKSKTKPQATIAFDINCEVAESATSSVPAAATKASQNFANAQPAIEQQNFVGSNSSGHIGNSAVEVDAATTSTAVATLALEPTTHAALSTAAAKIKAKAQATSTFEKNSEVESAVGNVAPAAIKTSPIFANAQPAVEQQNLVEANSSVAHSKLRSSADSSTKQAYSRTQSQSADNSSSASQEKSNSAVATSGSGTSFASTISAHTSPVQSVDAQPAVVMPDAVQSAVQSSAQSAAAMIAQSASAPAPVAAHAQPQIQSNPIPDPPRMVDSGQLRLTPNNSELKISVQLPDLGKVEVRAITTHDVTTAHLTAFRNDALPALSADRAVLEQALKSHDVILGSFQSHTQGQSAGQQQQNPQSSAPSSDRTSSIATAGTTAATTGASTVGFLPDYSSISIRA